MSGCSTGFLLVDREGRFEPAPHVCAEGGVWGEAGQDGGDVQLLRTRWRDRQCQPAGHGLLNTQRERERE